MRERFDAAASQAQKMAMLRRYGWSVPDLGRAPWSATDDATLMVEDALLPFRRDRSVIKTRNMNLHRLPWPRDRGSIHSGIWRGSAAALADRDAIGVFPVSGWWKEKPGLQRWDRSARYSLLVSVRAPGADIDIYTPIANQLTVSIPAA